MKTGPKFLIEYRGNQQTSEEIQSNNKPDFNTKGRYLVYLVLVILQNKLNIVNKRLKVFSDICI